MLYEWVIRDHVCDYKSGNHGKKRVATIYFMLKCTFHETLSPPGVNFSVHLHMHKHLP